MINRKVFKIQFFFLNNNLEGDTYAEAEDPFSGDDSDADPSYLPNDSSDSELELGPTTDEKRYNANANNNQLDTADEITKKSVRKRLRNCNQWKSTKRSLKTLAGETHTSKTGNLVPKKNMKPTCGPCKKKCPEKVDDNLRRHIFSSYWDPTKNWDVKRQFIISHVRSKPVDRVRSKDGSRSGKRKRTILYDFDVNGTQVDVCKIFFLNTLGISETVVRTALEKKNLGGFAARDMRGYHPPSNKLQQTVLDRVRSHIKSFPVYQSHYSREKSSKDYLGSDLNKERLYNLYKQKCVEDGIPQAEIVKPWAYKHIFDAEFNLGFKKPSSDTCDACDRFSLKLKDSSLGDTEKKEIQQAYEDHLTEAERRYQIKRKDKELSRSLEKTKVIMLDLQKCLPTPYLTNCQSFYLLKLWTINLTIYDATEKKSYCVMWDESKAGRGGNEIASGLLKWAKNVIVASGTEHLIIWSDNCPSQNRNIMMMVNYLWLLNVCPSLKTVEHKYLLRGHTHMEADHVHGLIERTVKKQPTMQIVTPWDWEQIVRSSGATVFSMEVHDFKNFEILYNSPAAPFISRKQNTAKENFLISSVVWFETHFDSPAAIFYKNNFTEENFKVVNLSKSIRKILKLPSELPPIRKCLKGVSKKKKEHLTTIIQWVPINFHDFYKNMPVATGHNQDDDE